ncbi:MAG: UDP-glucose/GDP-mannose dehydrogenase family protein [Myxococcales bacterium]|nr:UDP-glucose/GDP-mannose dehydrogenase family protein [Myxococcales bacterium]MDH3486056.1 UDP-glucose/GDP-mannose dehydrogenase family protein [Myxococcales bacterium]
MRLCVVGTGYVGLVTGTCFAATGQRVICVDKDASKIDRLQRYEIPIYEPGLEELVEENAEAGRLTFSTDLASAVRDVDLAFIAVGTPPTLDGEADLSAVFGVARELVEHANHDLVIVLKSTVPVGTNAQVQRLLADAKHDVQVVSNPEFLKEGGAIDDFMYPDRIVVGVRPGHERARRLVNRVYHPLNLSNTKIVWMNPESAELTKYAANTMLAMRISFMNELAVLCEEVGADVQSIRHGVGSDPRIGPQFLHAGPGYGGSCFPKDIKALVATARRHGIELELADATNRVNVRHRSFVARKLKRRFGSDLAGKRIAIWGLAFKPGTDDIRESPSLTTIEFLLNEGCSVVAHDPEAMENTKEMFGNKVELVSDAYGALKGADALMLLTEWREYQYPEFDRIKELMRTPVLLDGRNIWVTYRLAEQGFEYEGVGVQAVQS